MSVKNPPPPTYLASSKDLILGILFIFIWLIPILYVGSFKKDVPHMGLYLNDQYRCACLFTKSMTSWSTYYYQVRREGESHWIDVSQWDYGKLKPFGYRTRIQRILGKTYTPRGKKARRAVAEFIQQRYAELNPDAPRVVAVQFVRVMYPVGDPVIAQPQGHWTMPPLSTIPSSRQSVVGTIYLDGHDQSNPYNTTTVGNTRFKDKDLKNMANKYAVQVLKLNDSKVTDKGLEHFKGMNRLRHLYLANTKVSDKGMQYVKDLYDLSYLNLRQTRVTDDGIKQLGSLLNLEYLYLTETAVTNKALVYIKNFAKMKILLLSGTKIDDQGLKYIQELRNLKELRLADTKITDEGLKHLFQLSNLRKIDLTRTQVSYAGIEDLKVKLPGLQVRY